MISPYAYPGTFRVLPSQVAVVAPEPIPVERIIDIVAEYYNMPINELYKGSKNSRTANRVRVRYMCWHFIKKYHPKITLNQLGEPFGFHDHTTVIHGLQSIKDGIDTKHSPIGFEVTHIQAVIDAYSK